MVSCVSCAATRCPTGLQCIKHQKRKTRTLQRKTKGGIRSERAASVKYISARQPEMIRGEKGYIFWEGIINSWVVWRSKGEKLPVNVERNTREALQMGTQVSHLALASVNDRPLPEAGHGAVSLWSSLIQHFWSLLLEPGYCLKVGEMSSFFFLTDIFSFRLEWLLFRY